MSGSLGEREMLWEQELQASVSTAFWSNCIHCGRRGGLVISELDYGSRGLSSSPGHSSPLRCVLGQDTLLSQCLHPGV